MSRSPRKLFRPRVSRIARFERLEDRNLLSATNQAITLDGGVQQMPSLDVDPNDAKHVVVAYMDYSLRTNGYAGIGVAVSHDGGNTWQYSSIPLLADFDQGAANPTVKFDTIDHDTAQSGVQNRIYVSYMAATFLGPVKPTLTNPDTTSERKLGLESNNGIFVNSSDDGGLHWGAAATIVSHLYNGTQKVPFEIIPNLAIDTSAASQSVGALYITWTRIYPAGKFPGDPTATGGSDVMIAVSSPKDFSSLKDVGKFWTTRTRSFPGAGQITTLEDALNFGAGVPTGNGVDQYSRTAVGPEGEVYVSEYTGGEFTVSHSDAGAALFFVPTLTDDSGLPFGFGHQTLDFGLSNNHLRTLPVRAIAADPTRPGTVYVAEPIDVKDSAGNPLDHADIRFSRSDDFGVTWTSSIVTINDDNGRVQADGSVDDVSADQIMVQLSVGVDGSIGLIWLDTRRDPANKMLDVFGAVSTDGGLSFSPNFRITDQSFDPTQGALLTSSGETYLGDSIGLAMAGSTMYTAWTDTRQGNQDIYFRGVSFSPLPAPLNDRFEPNDAPSSATQLGSVAAPRVLPKLALTPGDEDWFELQALASAKLTITVNSSLPAGTKLELYDSSGTQLLASGVLTAGVKSIAYDANAGSTYLVRVAADTGGTFTVNSASYSLSVTNLTQDLGTIAHANIANASLLPGEQSYYLLKSTSTGSIVANLTSAAGFQGQATIELVDPATLAVLASDSGSTPHAKLPVGQGTPLLVHVTAGSSGQGTYSLDLVNLDQFSDPDLDILHFSAGANPSQEAVADFNHDGNMDVAMANAGSNTVSILFGNHNGTFSAPQQFAIGAFHLPNPAGNLFNLGTFRRDILTADFNEDRVPDLVVTNYDSSDVSVLLGNGDGTFQPQRRFDATAAPYGMTFGDVNGDHHLDLLVADTYAAGYTSLAVLLGRGDGTFEPETLQRLTNFLAPPTLTLADLDGNGMLDLIAAGGSKPGLDIYSGDGQGGFVLTAHYSGSREATDVIYTDVDGDHIPDVLATSLSAENMIYFLHGHADGSFDPARQFSAGQSPIAVKLVDWGSPVTMPDGSTQLGAPDLIPDLVVADSGAVTAVLHAPGPPGIVVLPGLGFDSAGKFLGYGAPVQIASAVQPLDLDVDDFNHDGSPDIGVVDHDEFFVIFGQPPAIVANNTRATARDLGAVVHSLQPTLTITPTQEDAWYRFQGPTEAFAGAHDEVLDFSGGFASLSGAGLTMEVVDSMGNRRGFGERFRVIASQGETLFVHISGASGNAGVRGSGAFTLAIDTLPQVAAVEAPALLPGQGGRTGGPTTSLTLVLQGDRLDVATAEVASNYTVTWLGPNGRKGGGDDQVIPVGYGLPAGAQAVVYAASGNRDVSSGLTYSTAVRQTITLLFGKPLPAGSYEVTVSPNVRAANFNGDEAQLLSSVAGITGHSVVQDVTRAVVQPVGNLGSLDVFAAGTRFLTQFYNDLGALLDSLLTASGDQTTTTQQIINQIVGRIGAALGPAGQRPVSLEVLFLDPVSLQLVDPDGRALKYDLGDARSLSNQLSGAFVEVGSNVEVVVIPNPVGHYELSVADVHARARGAAVFFGNQTTEVRSLTEALRHTGSQNFSFDFIADVAAASATVPQFAPLIATATVPAGFVRPIVPSLAAVLTSVNAFSELLLNSFSMTTTSIVDARGDSGGGRESQTAPLRDQTLVDELFGVWDRFDRDVFGQLKKEELDSVQALPSLFPALRIWQVMENLLDEFAAPHAARSGQNAPAKEHRAAKENADASESTQGNDKSAEDSAQSGATDAAGQDTASNAPIDDRSADSSNTTIQPEDSSADANTTGDIDADAIAA